MLDTWWSAFRTSPTELLKSADEVFQVPAMATKMSLQVDEYVVEYLSSYFWVEEY